MNSKFKKELNHFYIISKNENIEEIAQKCNTLSIKLLLENNTTPFVLKEGQILFVK